MKPTVNNYFPTNSNFNGAYRTTEWLSIKTKCTNIHATQWRKEGAGQGIVVTRSIFETQGSFFRCKELHTGNVVCLLKNAEYNIVDQLLLQQSTMKIA